MEEIPKKETKTLISVEEAKMDLNALVIFIAGLQDQMGEAQNRLKTLIGQLGGLPKDD